MEQSQEVKEWISEILGITLPDLSLYELLRDGVVLCNLINKIKNVKKSKFPSLKKINFFQMENICYFIENARILGVPDSENFLTVDLFENKNIQQVILCIYSLSRNLYRNGMTDLRMIGPKIVEPTKITFTEEQLDEAKRAVSLQYGDIGRCEKKRETRN